jgi:hypoxanthine phosphoribosyltransferase
MNEPSPIPKAILHPDIQEIILSTDEIQKRVQTLGQQISRDYLGRSPIFVGVLKGVIIFMADLLRSITIPVEIDFIAVANYSIELRDQGVVRMVKDLEIPIANRHIIFIEDVIDTGLTLNYLLQNLQARQPASLEICTIFNKPDHRIIDLPIKYKGFDLPDRFVVGYGLDFKEKYRNLPYLGLLKASILRGQVKSGNSFNDLN